MKWTKFSNASPTDDCRSYFITDSVKVWTDSRYRTQISWEKFASKYPEFCWAEIPLPEVPKKELHKCVQNHSHASLCQEDEQGRLLFSITNPHASTSMSCFVEFCPFCGYSIKEKE